MTFLLDPHGIVRWVGLIKSEDQLLLGAQFGWQYIDGLALLVAAGALAAYNFFLLGVHF